VSGRRRCLDVLSVGRRRGAGKREGRRRREGIAGGGAGKKGARRPEEEEGLTGGPHLSARGRERRGEAAEWAGLG
jgi:hypothetical protein